MFYWSNYYPLAEVWESILLTRADFLYRPKMAEDKWIVILISNCVRTKDELQSLFYEKKNNNNNNNNKKRNYSACRSFDK